MDLLTLMGNIGGLYEALIALGTLLISYNVQRYFMSHIIDKVFVTKPLAENKAESRLSQTL